ncbi:sesquipedalian [Anaeramoeba flamelloides]|uniref:Sesquipedalian n=1 Tax=Anaeramoeba flamelloides TaxID=1746091 RepID=A0AAV7YGR1_9EUKA|nr:sesquipedalian [Anaeramoeba flamelloides]
MSEINDNLPIQQDCNNNTSPNLKNKEELKKIIEDNQENENENVLEKEKEKEKENEKEKQKEKQKQKENENETNEKQTQEQKQEQEQEQEQEQKQKPDQTQKEEKKEEEELIKQITTKEGKNLQDDKDKNEMESQQTLNEKEIKDKGEQKTRGNDKTLDFGNEIENKSQKKDDLKKKEPIFSEKNEKQTSKPKPKKNDQESSLNDIFSKAGATFIEELPKIRMGKLKKQKQKKTQTRFPRMQEGKFSENLYQKNFNKLLSKAKKDYQDTLEKENPFKSKHIDTDVDLLFEYSDPLAKEINKVERCLQNFIYPDVGSVPETDFASLLTTLENINENLYSKQDFVSKNTRLQETNKISQDVDTYFLLSSQMISSFSKKNISFKRTLSTKFDKDLINKTLTGKTKGSNLKKSSLNPNMQRNKEKKAVSYLKYEKLIRTRSENSLMQSLYHNTKQSHEKDYKPSSNNMFSNLVEEEIVDNLNRKSIEKTDKSENSDNTENSEMGTSKQVTKFTAKDGVIEINKDMILGIQFCIQNNIVDNDPKKISQFFYNQKEILPERIGLFFSIGKFWSKVIIPLDKEIIYKCFWEFGVSYHIQNRNVFPVPDSVAKIAFKLSIIKPKDNVPVLTSENEFIEFCQRTATTEKMPLDLLRSCYQDACQVPIPLFSHLLSDHLYKQGGKFKSWKKRWFVLTPESLVYYKSEKQKKFMGIIPLSKISVTVIKPPKKTKYRCRFKVMNDKNEKFGYKSKNHKLKPGNHSFYVLVARNQEVLDRWVEAITRNSLLLATFSL